MTTYQELVDGLEEVRELIKGYQDVSFGDYGVAEANKAIRAVELIDSLTPASRQQDEGREAGDEVLYNIAYQRGCLDEHKITCHKALLQYDENGKLTGNMRCGEGWKCERLVELESGKR